MFSIRQVTRLGVGAALLLTGCGQVAGSPLAAAGNSRVAAESIRSDQEAVTRAVKAQLETAFFKFRDLSVSALAYQNSHTFRGIADITTRAGMAEYTVYGRYDLTAKKATIAYKVLLNSKHHFVLFNDKVEADEVLDLTADMPGVELAKLDIKNQLETRSLHPRSYSVISGIKLADLDPTFTTKSFTAHERVVGHGWEERYTIDGTYDAKTRKAGVLGRKLISSTGVRPWILY